MKKFNFIKVFALMAAVFAFGFAGCEQVTDIGKGSGGMSGAKGTLTVSTKFDGIQPNVLKNVGGDNGGAGLEGENLFDIQRTVYPGDIGSSIFTKIEASFAPSIGGDPVVMTGPANAISVTATLPVGTYNVTLTAYTGDIGTYKAVAVGTVSDVGVAENGNTPVSVPMGPETETQGNGMFSYEITLPDALDTATLVVSETIGGGAVNNGNITLTANQKNKGTIELAAGYYWVRVSLAKGSEYAGLGPEALHIYPGLTSDLPAVTYTDADFAVIAAVSAFDLTNLFAAPMVKAAPAATVDGTEYAGTIAWSPSVSGNKFAATQIYTATVTLAAKAGYTFEGVDQDAFFYTNATSVNNAANSGTVTVEFKATGTIDGEQEVEGSFDYDDIPVNGYTEGGVTVTKGGASVTLSVSGYEDVAWYVDGIAAAAGTGNSFAINPENYTVKDHTLTVTATKNATPYSRTLKFKVAAEGTGGGGTALSLTVSLTDVTGGNLATWLASQSENTDETPYIIKLASDGGWNTDTQFKSYNSLANALSGITSRYVTIDMSDLTIIIINGTSATTTDADKIKTLHIPAVVGIVLPKTVTTMANVFSGMSYIKYVEFPVEVNISITSNNVFLNSGVTKVVLRGNNVNFNGSSNTACGLGTSFYSLFGVTPQAGTYVGTINGSWAKQN
ncbi:MAG: hypothetical protein LBK66_05815 [Spirochaetaceae bacterium]|nr:hypothetical protein [Spirochaetaceae bacterium]